MGVRLPKEYQEVEYLDSPGLCFVQKDIPLLAGDVLSAEVVFQILKVRAELWVSGWFAQIPRVPEFGIYNGSWYTANGASFELLGGSGWTGKYKGTLQNISFSSATTMNWRSFARGGVPAATLMNQPSCRIWESTVSVNDVLVLDWVPCYRKSDREPGMFDLISGTFFTNEGTGEGFTVGNDIIYHKAGNLYQLMPLLMAQPHRESIIGTGGIATFNDDFKGLMKLSVPFTPIQASGTPSPENPLLISGWTGANISETEKNFADVFNDPSNPDKNASWSGGGSVPFTYDTTEQAYYTNNHRAVKFKLKPGTYTISFWAKQKSTGYPYAVLGFGANIFPASPTSYSTSWTRYDRQLTLTTETEIVGTFYWTIWIRDFQIEKSNTVSDYETYHGQTIPIDWQTEAGTVYGGTFTLNEDGSVDMSARWALLDMSNYGISAQVDGTSKKAFNMRAGYSAGSYYKAASKAICSDFLFKGYASWSGFQNPDSMDYGMWLYWGADNIFYFVTDKDYVVNSKVAVELKESLIKTYHFDNVGQLKSFIGQNNVWTDLNGDPTVGYWKHG